MNDLIIAYGLPAERNETFRSRLTAENYSYITCSDMHEIEARIKDKPQLILLDLSSLSDDDAEKIVFDLRKVTFIPIFALVSSGDIVSAVIWDGADYCFTPDSSDDYLISHVKALIRFDKRCREHPVF